MFGLLERIMGGLTTEADAFQLVFSVILLVIACSGCAVVATIILGGY